MRCPRGHAGSSPAPGTSSTDTTAPAGFTAAGAVVEVRVSALGAGRDAVGLDACGLSAVEVTDPVHAQRVRRAVDPGRRSGGDDDQVVLLQALLLAQQLVDHLEHDVGILDRKSGV